MEKVAPGKITERHDIRSQAEIEQDILNLLGDGFVGVKIRDNERSISKVLFNTSGQRVRGKIAIWEAMVEDAYSGQYDSREDIAGQANTILRLNRELAGLR